MIKNSFPNKGMLFLSDHHSRGLGRIYSHEIIKLPNITYYMQFLDNELLPWEEHLSLLVTVSLNRSEKTLVGNNMLTELEAWGRFHRWLSPPRCFTNKESEAPGGRGRGQPTSHSEFTRTPDSDWNVLTSTLVFFPLRPDFQRNGINEIINYIHMCSYNFIRILDDSDLDGFFTRGRWSIG